jgi:hypothetical protein
VDHNDNDRFLIIFRKIGSGSSKGKKALRTKKNDSCDALIGIMD